MATTDVDICNLALFRVRAKEIGSLLERSAQAEKCRIFYPQARDSVLSSVDWSFAKTVKTLQLKSEKPQEWLYGYGEPIDSLKILYLLPAESSENESIYTASQSIYGTQEKPVIQFEMLTGDNGQSVIATNQATARVAYTKAVTDVRLFGALCVEAISWKLAIDLAIPLGGDAGKSYRDDAKVAYRENLDIADAQLKNQAQNRLRQQTPRAVQARSGIRSSYSR